MQVTLPRLWRFLVTKLPLILLIGFAQSECHRNLHPPPRLSQKWDDTRGVWRGRPRHDEASHRADAFLKFACSSVSSQEELARGSNARPLSPAAQVRWELKGSLDAVAGEARTNCSRTATNSLFFDMTCNRVLCSDQEAACIGETASC